MNCFGGNSALWILILLLLTANQRSGCGCDNNAFSGCSTPILIALLFCLCRNGTLCSLLGCNNGDNGCGCGCN